MDASSLALVAQELDELLVSFFAWHGWVHVHFQLSPRILHDFFVFFVFRVNGVDASQLSSIVEFGFLDFLTLAFLSFERLSEFWSIHIAGSSSCMKFCQSPPGPHISFGRCFFQKSDFREFFPRV